MRPTFLGQGTLYTGRDRIAERFRWTRNLGHQVTTTWAAFRRSLFELVEPLRIPVQGRGAQARQGTDGRPEAVHLRAILPRSRSGGARARGRVRGGRAGHHPRADDAINATVEGRACTTKSGRRWRCFCPSSPWACRATSARQYEHVVRLPHDTSSDGMTADWFSSSPSSCRRFGEDLQPGEKRHAAWCSRHHQQAALHGGVGVSDARDAVRRLVIRAPRAESRERV